MNGIDIHASVRDSRFLARYAVLLTLLVAAYIGAVTFVPIGNTGIKYADIAVPLLLGTVLGGLVGFWFGASKANAPPPPAPEIVATSTSATPDKPGSTEVHVN